MKVILGILVVIGMITGGLALDYGGYLRSSYDKNNSNLVQVVALRL